MNATSSEDLFRALKGGGNNFGIVTRFDLAAFPQGEILEGAITSPFSERDAVFEAFANLADSPHYDPYASIVTGLTWLPSSGWQTVGTTAAYTKSVANSPPAFQKFLSVPNTTSTLNLTKLSVVSDENPTPLWEWAFYTITFGVSAKLLSDITDSMNETFSTTAIPGLVLWTCALEPLPTVFTAHSNAKGGNSLGVSPQDGNAVVMLITGIWNDTTSDALVEQTGEKIVEDITDLARNAGLLHQFQYMNYAGPSQSPIESYGTASMERLKEASKKYDPKKVFQKQVPGGFKLYK